MLRVGPHLPLGLGQDFQRLQQRRRGEAGRLCAQVRAVAEFPGGLRLRADADKQHVPEPPGEALQELPHVLAALQNAPGQRERPGGVRVGDQADHPRQQILVHRPQHHRHVRRSEVVTLVGQDLFQQGKRVTVRAVGGAGDQGDGGGVGADALGLQALP